jgi:hypothetical protein
VGARTVGSHCLHPVNAAGSGVVARAGPRGRDPCDARELTRVGRVRPRAAGLVGFVGGRAWEGAGGLGLLAHGVE